jgi:hypothetical protein
MDCQLESELAQDAVPMSRDKAIQCGLDLETLCALAVGDRQVEEQMAVDNVTESFALAAPNGS